MFGRDLVISAPRNVVVTHSVSPTDQLTAELSWTNGFSKLGRLDLQNTLKFDGPVSLLLFKPGWKQDRQSRE